MYDHSILFFPLFQTKSRDHDARDYYKARRQHQLISDDLLAKDVQIEDTKKRIKELEIKLADFATAYEVRSILCRIPYSKKLLVKFSFSLVIW